MYCPSCGANNSTEQKFCRSCGLNLEKSAESVLEQLPSAHSAVMLKRGLRLQKLGVFAWNTFGLVILASVGAVIYHLYSGVGIWWEGFMLAFIISGFMAAAHGILTKTFEKNKQKRNRQLLVEIVENSDTAELPQVAAFETNSTSAVVPTNPLFSESRTKKLG